MKKSLIIIAIIVVVFSIFLLIGLQDKEIPQPEVKEPVFLNIKDTSIKTEVVTSLPERILGLSGRQSLPNDAGMLFIFPQSGFHSIWMKDMLFPIDILWLDDIFSVVDFKKDVSPDTFPNAFEPKIEALYVLEVNSGFIDISDIKIGDTFIFSE